MRFTNLLERGELSGEYVKSEKNEFYELLFEPNEMERLYRTFLTSLGENTECDFRHSCVEVWNGLWGPDE